MLDAPCKHHSGARPSTHTLRQCGITKRIMRGDVPPPPAPAPGAGQPPPPPAPTDEPGFFVFVPFPNGAGGTTQAAGSTPVAQPGDADAGPCRSADEAPPSPRTVARPHRQDSASMEGRCRLFGRAIAAIDRRLGRHSGLASDLPNGVPPGVVYISSSEEEGGTSATTL